MYSATVIIVVSTLALLLFVQETEGLRCYDCLKADSGKDSSSYHKKCNEGKLPDDLSVECKLTNLIPLGDNGQGLNASDVDSLLRQSSPFSCLKLYGKHRNGEDGVIKGCGVNTGEGCIEGSFLGYEGSIYLQVFRR